MEGLGFPLREEAVLRTLTEDVLKSSEIEGEALDQQQVRSSIARRMGMDIGALTPADRNVEGVVEMMLDATQKLGEPLTAERLFAWHASLFPTGHSGMSRILVGAWRDDNKGPMQVVSGPVGRERVHYQAPPAERAPHEMEVFLRWFNGDAFLDPVLRAALAHLWFVTIHPFEDGNGRIARAIADMALARSEMSAQRFYSMSARMEKQPARSNALKSNSSVPSRSRKSRNSSPDAVVEAFGADFARIWLLAEGDLCEHGCCHAAVHRGAGRLSRPKPLPAPGGQFRALHRDRRQPPPSGDKEPGRL